MKRYLVTMTVLLIAALGAGIAVWFFYQDLNSVALVEESSVEKKEVLSTPEAATEPESAESGEKVEVTEPITISAASLTENQRKMLEAFGLDRSEYTITEAMIACAKEKTGEARLTEILNGAAPTPFEAMSLLPCLKK